MIMYLKRILIWTTSQSPISITPSFKVFPFLGQHHVWFSFACENAYRHGVHPVGHIAAHSHIRPIFRKDVQNTTEE